MDPNHPNPFSRSPLAFKLIKFIKLIFIIPQLLMGGLFAGIPAYLFQKYWYPAFQLYQQGSFNHNQSGVVLFGFLAFGGIFFVAGIAMLIGAFKNLGSLLTSNEKEPVAFGRAISPEEVSLARNRTLRFSKFKMFNEASKALNPTSQPKQILRPILQPDGFYQVKSHAYNAVLGFFLLGFAIFWNGVIGFGISDFTRGGSIQIVFGLFILPFVVIGLGLLIASLYFLSSLLHPNLSVRLRATPNSKTLTGSWSFASKPTRLNSVHISLNVSEKIFEGKGDDRTTKSIPVFDQVLLERADLRVSEKGEFTYRWPENLELPNETEQRAVVWMVNLHAKAVGIPDVRMWIPVIIQT